MATPVPCLDLKRALLDPAAAFGTPEELLKNAFLSRGKKAEILCRWAYDAAELAVAEEEGMGGGERSQLDHIMKALSGLTVGFGAEQVAPTKHGGLCLRAGHDAPDSPA